MKKATPLTSMLNTQIQKEFESAYLYLGFAAFFEHQGLQGFSEWYRQQAEEEKEHAVKIYDYLCKTGQTVELLPISALKAKPASIQQALEKSLEHEEYITSLITALYFQAEKEKDLFAKNFLNWFVNEQFEEEQKAGELIIKYNLFGSTPEGLHALDKELGCR